MTIARGMLHHARRAPEGDALVLDGTRCTYGELSAGVRATAQALDRSVGRPGARIGIVARPGPAFFEGFLGAGLAGMVAMVLNNGWSDRERRHALEDGRPDLLLPPDPGGVVVCRPRNAAGVPPPAEEALPRVGVEQPFYVGFTSGSTGRPRGYVRSHRSWLASVEASSPVLGVRAGDHLVAPGSLDHSLFLYAAVHGLTIGATVHLQHRFRPHALVGTLRSLPGSRLVVVPTMLASLLAAAGPAARLPRVRSVISSGAVLPAPLLRRAAEVFCEAEFVDFYGASELSFVSYRHPTPSDPPEFVGKPFAGVEVSVRRPDGDEAGPGEPGTLWVRSRMVFDGYLDPATGRSTQEAGWVTVGDLARLDEQGSLHLAGREGTMLNCGGRNVHPEEIEHALLEWDGIVEAVVVGIDDVDHGQLPCALLRFAGDRPAPARGALQAHCRTRLAPGKRPRRWLAVEDFPRTPSGKVARAALTEALRAGTLVTRELP